MFILYVNIAELIKTIMDMIREKDYMKQLLYGFIPVST